MRRPLLLAALTTAGCLRASTPSTDEGIPIGVLLPYTGELATAGENLERAVLLANEQLAAAEPDPATPPFRLVFRDTHSDDVIGLGAVNDLINGDKATFILGPEEPHLADAMADMLRDSVAITGGAVSLESRSGKGNLFRIVPTARRMALALADRLDKDSVKSLAIIYVPDDYGTAFSSLAATEFTARKHEVRTMAAIGTGSNSDLVRKVVATNPDAILLVAYPTEGAAVVQEWATLASNERWYFGPSLRSEVFALNVPPGLLDGSVGVSAGLPADASNFAREFQQRWRGEAPSPNAHYYFDAMVLAGLAYRWAVATGRPGTPPTPADLARALVAVSGPGGIQRSWQELGAALADVEGRGGQGPTDIDYRGASGPVDFGMDGSVPQGFVQSWTIRNGAIDSLDAGP